MVSIKSFDEQGRPALHEWHRVHEVRQRFDEQGRRVRLTCHDEGGAPARCAPGFFGVATEHDADGREIGDRYLDEAGRPTREGRRYVLDAAGRTLAVHNQREDGRRTERSVRDGRGRLLEMSIVDGSGKPATVTSCYTGLTCPDGAWHAVRLRRDDSGRIIANVFFDAHGQRLAVVDCSRDACLGDS